MQPNAQQAKLARSDLLGRNLQHSLLIGGTARLHTSLVKRASRARRCKLHPLCFVPELPILTQTSRVAKGQGGIDHRSIDGTDETIDSKASFTAICAEDWCIDREVTTKHYCVNYGSA